ncbi:MAG: phosphodiester glycosidase family protein [Phaeodactylibacter sp.]|nr:phosphodiester glycosidase family protein [Phaeodactylibacter sp.]
MENTTRPTGHAPARNPRKKWLAGIVITLAAIASAYLLYTFTAGGAPAAPTQKETAERKQPGKKAVARVGQKGIYQGPATLNFSHRENAYAAFVFNSARHEFEFYYQVDGGEKYLALSKARETAAEKGDSLLFATNAGIFDPQYRPVGLFVSNGKEVMPLNTEDGGGNFFLKPNGVFFMKKNGELGILESEEYKKEQPAAWHATQSGPLLLRHDSIHPAFKEGSPNRLLRSGVGIISPTEAVFLISDGPVNFYDFSMAFREKFHCREALYLDGVISQAYLPGLKRPEEGERPFAGIIGVKRK